MNSSRNNGIVLVPLFGKIARLATRPVLSLEIFQEL